MRFWAIEELLPVREGADEVEKAPFSVEQINLGQDLKI